MLAVSTMWWFLIGMNNWMISLFNLLVSLAEMLPPRFHISNLPLWSPCYKPHSVATWSHIRCEWTDLQLVPLVTALLPVSQFVKWDIYELSASVQFRVATYISCSSVPYLCLCEYWIVTIGKCFHNVGDFLSSILPHVYILTFTAKASL